MDVTALQCCMLYNLWLCWWQSWPDCGIVLSVMLSVGCPLLWWFEAIHVIAACLWSHVLTCRHSHCLLLVVVWGFVVELIHHFSPYWPWLMGCILISCRWNSFDTEINSSLDIPYSLSLSVLISVFFYSDHDSKTAHLHPSKPAYHQLLVFVQLLLYHPVSLVAWLTVYLIVDYSYSALPKSSFLSFGVFFSSFFLVMAEWTRPPLGWWLALSTTSWETGTMECPLAPSMSSRQYVCAFCGCNCLSVYVCTVSI